MPPRVKKSAAAKKVDPTVENQENPGINVEARESTEETQEPEVAKTAAANDVDKPVENQENPGTSTEERESTNPEPEVAEVPKMAPAHEVDETVHNQMNPGLEMVDRHPEPVILEDAAGVKFDVSKPFPELITDDPEAEKRRARVRQTESVLDAKNIEGSNDPDNDEREHLEIEFLESGLTVAARVWKAGQVLVLEDNEASKKTHQDAEGNVWYELSADEQMERYGKVFFEKR